MIPRSKRKLYSYINKYFTWYQISILQDYFDNNREKCIIITEGNELHECSIWIINKIIENDKDYFG